MKSYVNQFGVSYNVDERTNTYLQELRNLRAELQSFDTYVSVLMDVAIMRGVSTPSAVTEAISIVRNAKALLK